MLKALPKFVVVLALACSIGLHWEFLQSIAWVSMVVSYSQTAPLTTALQKTFDGTHPCSLCRQVADGKRSEKKTDVGPAKKLEFRYTPVALIFRAPSMYWEVPMIELPAELISIDPPVPPPRNCLV